ncbi:S49 family peptidase [Ramlibacter rhizophilus]|uniref:S49 family peptidase n=2 Tax=Ramlibacter rhizophilus TaxID=1781167 RepID=A0A4Z0BCV6_9BURK|nr:S49 family peptidase [Ramlibacter rhizophilus]
MLANLQEQRAARRWRVGLRVAWLVFLVFLAWALLWRGGPSSASKALPHTALVEIRGAISADDTNSAENVVASLRSAFEDAGAQGVVLLIDSPGGSPVQAGLINDEIQRLREKHKKPIYTVVEESCASAAYYIAAATDRIYVNKASIVGSIGVLMDGFGFTGLIDKLGIERRLITAGEHKGFLDPFRPQTAQDRAYVKDMLQEVHQQFIDVVRQGRGKRLKEDAELFSGLFWTGSRAIELGLADQLGSLDYVAREVLKAEEVIDYTRRENLAERLASRFGASIGTGAVRALQLAPSIR